MAKHFVEYGPDNRDHNYERGPQFVGNYDYVLDSFLKLSKQVRGVDYPDIYDVGAGLGIYSEYLKLRGANITAIDPSPDSMKRTSARKIYSTLERSQLPAQSADGIHVKDALAHVRNKKEFFKHCQAVLRPGGVVMCVFDQLSSSIASMIKFIERRDGYSTTTLEQIERVAELCGIAIEDITHWQPDRGQPDWYDDKPARIVVTGRKT